MFLLCGVEVVGFLEASAEVGIFQVNFDLWFAFLRIIAGGMIVECNAVS